MSFRGTRVTREGEQPPPSPHRHPYRVVVVGRDGRWSKARTLGVGRDAQHCGAASKGKRHPMNVMISTSHVSTWSRAYLSARIWGTTELKGISTPLSLYRVVRESEAQSRFEVVVRKGLTPLVGRNTKYGLVTASAGSRRKAVKAKWCCSAASRALANHGCCRNSKRSCT